MSRIFLLSVFLFIPAGLALLQAQTEPMVPPPHVLLQIERRTPDQMNAGDRQLVAERQSELDSAIAESGYDVRDGNLSSEQAVCPLFAGTILLRYDSHAGHPSRFIAVLDRSSNEVRVAPGLRSGNSPFRSSYKNDNTYSIFNQILAREGIRVGNQSLEANGQWVKLALCYAELSGEHPTTLLTDTLYGEAFERNVNVPLKRIQPDGSIALEFCDVSDSTATTQWSLRFDARGRLLAVDLKRRPLNPPLRQLKTDSGLYPPPRAK